MLSHVFPLVILENEGILPIEPLSPSIPGRVPSKYRQDIDVGTKPALPKSRSASTTSLNPQPNNTVYWAASHHRKSLPPIIISQPSRISCPTPLRYSFTPAEPIPVKSVSFAGTALPTINIAHRSAIPHQPWIPLRPGHVPKNDKYSLFPAYVSESTPSQRFEAQQARHLNSFNRMRPPRRAEDETHSSPPPYEWSSERYYARQRVETDTPPIEKQRFKKRQFFKRALDRLRRMLSRKRTRSAVI